MPLNVLEFYRDDVMEYGQWSLALRVTLLLVATKTGRYAPGTLVVVNALGCCRDTQAGSGQLPSILMVAYLLVVVKTPQ